MPPSLSRLPSRLPILHTQRGDHTAMFSNTARAHRLGTTHDWVILYRDGESGGHQYTLITSNQSRTTRRPANCSRPRGGIAGSSSNAKALLG